MTGVKAEILVECRQVAPSKYRCIYRPQIAGAYLLDIMWADRQVKGSPFKVNITSSSDASKVVTFGMYIGLLLVVHLVPKYFLTLIKVFKIVNAWLV